MTRYFAKIIFLISGFFAFSLFSDIGNQKDISNVDSGEKNPCCFDAIKGNQVEFRHVEGDGIGYKKGYTTGELLLSRWVEDGLFFIDGRVHVLNNGNAGASGGLGYRYNHLESQYIYGVNGFFDYRYGSNNHFWQTAIGFEALGKIFNYRINGYLPYGTTYKTKSIEFDRFEENHAFVQRKIDQAMWGVDAEFEGLAYTYKDLDLLLAIGGYYYNGKNERGAVGARARATVSIYDSLFLKAFSSYDNVFRFNFQGEIGLTFGFGKEKCSNHKKSRSSISCEDRTSIEKRMLSLPKRNDLIVISRAKKEDLALDPNTSEPITFLHVDNTSSISSGTVENPYATLAEAQTASNSGDTIYIHYGNGTSSGMSSGITLQNYQRLLGEGASHPLYTQVGLATIPQRSTIKPIITNITASQPAVSLADNCEVAGISVSAASGSGIQGSNITNGSIIRDNFICENGTGAGTHAGVNFLLASGVVVGGTMEITNNVISSSSGTDGIFIGPSGATLDGPAGINLKIENNDINANDEDGFHVFRTGAVSGLFTLTGSISNNSFCGNSSEAIYFQHDTAAGTIDLNLSISNNRFSANTYGIRFLRANGVMAINNNTFSNNSNDAAFINAGPGVPENLTIDVIGNRCYDDTDFEIELDSGTVYVVLRDNVYIPESAGNHILLDNNSGVTDNFVVKLGSNDAAMDFDDVTVIP